MLSGYGDIWSSEAWDFAADEVLDDNVGSASTWALDALETCKGDIEKAEAHTNWASPLFRNPAFTREYCKALYNPENAADYAEGGEYYKG